jgi:hypothetical protein
VLLYNCFYATHFIFLAFMSGITFTYLSHVLIDKVRVADLIGDRVPNSSMVVDEKLTAAKLSDASLTLGFRGEEDQANYNTELKQSKNSGKGVLYCELDGENGLSVKSEDAKGEKDMVDPSIPCIATAEEP